MATTTTSKQNKDERNMSYANILTSDDTKSGHDITSRIKIR